MHTCSIQSKTAQKNSRKHLEKQKLGARNNFKSTQLKTENNSCTGYTGGAVPVHPKATGYTGALGPVYPDSDARFRVENINCTGYTNAPLDKHRSMHRVILQRACFWAWKVLFSTDYTGGMESKHRCIHIANDQRLCSLNCKIPLAPVTPVPLRNKHRCNIVSLCTVSDANSYYLDSV